VVKVMFVNNVPDACGVKQFGLRVYDVLSKSTKFKTQLAACYNADDLIREGRNTDADTILYNFHSLTIPWANDEFLAQHPNKRHIAIVHEPGMVVSKRMNRVIPQDTLPRVLSECPDTYVDRGVPVIGSFGFASWHKGFHNLILKIQNEFDEAIFRLHVPASFYCYDENQSPRKIIDECHKRITKPGISIEADTDFFTETELLEWLNKNTLNAFHYEPLPYDPGISSVVDYALSARRPLAITKSPMFRHLVGATPSICMEDNSLKTIIENGLTPLYPFYDRWSVENAVKYWEDVLC